FNITPDAADHLVFATEPVNTAVGSALLPAVRIEDQFGNTVTSDNRNITLAIQGDPSGGSAVLGGAKMRATVNGVAAYEETMPNSRTVYVESAPETEKLIIDLPAGIGMNELVDVTYGAGSILIPVMPSEIDVYSTSRFIAELLLVAQIDRRDCQLAVVANRTRQNTRSFKALMRFLFSLKIPVITALRDSQNFVHAAANGMCLHEMPAHKTKKDIAQMDLIVTWLDQWGARRLDSFNAHRFDYESVEPVFVTSRFRNAR
ncbi:MAG: hypothetical protein IIB76_10855, partial [Proteobacteria bacterium]|nr:hypothetical protein [Pseudomonadota bacterium]